MTDRAKDRVSTQIRDAIDEARSAQMSYKEFIEQAWLGWEEALEDEKKDVRKQFNKTLL